MACGCLQVALRFRRPATERWWARPLAPLLAWCSSAEAEAAVAEETGDAEEASQAGLDGSGTVDGASEPPPGEDEQRGGEERHAEGLRGAAQEVAALARDTALFAADGTAAALGAAGAVVVDVCGTAVDAAGAAASLGFSGQQQEQASSPGAAHVPGSGSGGASGSQ